MTTKLRLSLADKIIIKAKEIAAERKTSVSKLMSNYFERLSQEEAEKKLSSLIGILKPKDKSVNVEEIIKTARWEHLKKKHKL